MVSLGCEFYVYFDIVLSALVLGAGFRPGAFRPWVAPSRRWVGLGGSLLRPYPYRSMLFLYLLPWPPASARNII